MQALTTVFKFQMLTLLFSSDQPSVFTSLHHQTRGSHPARDGARTFLAPADLPQERARVGTERQLHREFIMFGTDLDSHVTA